MKEKDIILGCIKEEEKSQRILFNHFQDKMFSVCKENLDNEEEAKEALIEGFIKVYDNIKYFKGDSLEKWMSDIMIKECDKMKKKKKWNPLNWQGRREDQVMFSEDFVAMSVAILIIIVIALITVNVVK